MFSETLNIATLFQNNFNSSEEEVKCLVEFSKIWIPTIHDKKPWTSSELFKSKLFDGLLAILYYHQNILILHKSASDRMPEKFKAIQSLQ